MESSQPVLTVQSVYDAADWYRKVLGFETRFLNDDGGEEDALNYAKLANGAASIHLGREREMQNTAGQGSVNFVTREFEEAMQSARGAGAEFFIELSQIPTGARTFGIKDPDGNLLVFVEESQNQKQK